MEALGADPELAGRRQAILNDPVMVVTRESGLRSIHVLSEEMAFVAPVEHNLDLVASDDATTCSIVVLIGDGVVAVAHLDSQLQMAFFLKKWETLTSGTPTRVAIVGGYDDERGIAHPISIDILQALLSSQVVYQVEQFVTGTWNTKQTDEGVLLPPPKFEVPDVDTNPFKMAAVGNLQLLKTLVEPEENAEGKTPAPLNVNAKDPYGCTPLIWAARNGYLEVMDYLAAHGADLEVTSFGGLRALHHAVNHSRLPIVERLIELGVTVEPKDDAGNTPLHFAASRGILNPILLLLNAGAKVNVTTAQEVSPLMKAVSAGHTTAVEKLLDSDANPNHVNAEGNSALHLAARGGFNSIVKALLDAGATPAVRNKAGKTPAELASSSSIAKMLG
ncbi:ankyrin-like protein [Phytophthora cinnamomi]|uniref:ankyrin-like protein n=1 Tax=Phytophthora cinnamomi TaxID=4785 RepID=UPI003559547C|nr:ankyrin-like protein [Phytophthora cinnamomi]